MSKFTDLKATYTQLTGKQVPVGTSTSELEEAVQQLQKPARKTKAEATHKRSSGVLGILKAKMMAQATQAQAMAEVLKAFPDITRKDFFHSAVEVGINIRTAKNYFDRNRRN